MRACYEDRWVTASGLRTRYWDVGNGEPLILLHGIGAHAGFWRASIPRLSQDYRVIVPDICGSGRSEIPPEISRAMFSGWLAHFIDAVGAAPANLVASSMGGGIALAMSLDYPRQVRSLVLLATLGLGTKLGVTFRLMSIPIIGELLVPVDAKGIRRELLRITKGDQWLWEGLVKETEELAHNVESRQFFFKLLRWGVSVFGGVRARASVDSELSDIDVPVQLIWGRQDTVFPLAVAHSAVERIPDAELVVLENCGHMPHLERPEELTQCVIQFLASTESQLGSRVNSD